MYFCPSSVVRHSIRIARHYPRTSLHISIQKPRQRRRTSIEVYLSTRVEKSSPFYEFWTTMRSIRLEKVAVFVVFMSFE